VWGSGPDLFIDIYESLIEFGLSTKWTDQVKSNP
jgi:hypothetical protein